MTAKKEVRSIHVALGCVFREAHPSDKSRTSAKDEGISYQVLLALRRERELPEIDNMWELPGGKVEPNEMPEFTVERELLEETGYQVRAIAPLDIIYSVIRNYPDYRQETFISCYECKLVSSEKIDTKPDNKIGETRWFNLDQVDYFKTLVGSREFLFFLARKHGIKIDSTQKTLSYALFQVPPKGGLIKKSGETRRGREYVVNIQLEPDLSNYYLVTYRRGMWHRKWQKPNIEEFPDNDQMIQRTKERVRKRFYHGYNLIDYDNDFPIIEWIRSRGYPINLLKPQLPPSQLFLPTVFIHKQSDEDNQ